MDHRETDFTRQDHLLHRAGEIDELDRLELLHRRIGGIEIGHALAIECAAHHQEGLAEAVDRNDIAAAHAVIGAVPEILPGRDLAIALVGAHAEADGAGEDADADHLVADGVRIDIGDIRDLLGVDLGFDDPHLQSSPLLVGIGVQHVIDRR